MESEESQELIKGGKPAQKSQKITLQKAIDLGEYDPDYLSTFPEFC